MACLPPAFILTRRASAAAAATTTTTKSTPRSAHVVEHVRQFSGVARTAGARRKPRNFGWVAELVDKHRRVSAVFLLQGCKKWRWRTCAAGLTRWDARGRARQAGDGLQPRNERCRSNSSLSLWSGQSFSCRLQKRGSTAFRDPVRTTVVDQYSRVHELCCNYHPTLGDWSKRHVPR